MPQLYRGCIALLGPEIDELVNDILSSPTWLSSSTKYAFSPTTAPYHVTILSKDELRGITSRSPSTSATDVLNQLRTSLQSNPPQLHAVGIGARPNGKPTVFYVVLVWGKGQELRRQLGLAPKHYHITLSSTDVHNVDKGISTLLIPLPDSPSEGLLEDIAWTSYLFEDYDTAEEFAVRLCQATPDSPKGFARLGEIASKAGKPKLAMLAFACALTRSSPDQVKAKEHCVRKIKACAKETEWGTVVAEHETAQLPHDITQLLLEPWPGELRSCFIDAWVGHIPRLLREPRDHLFIPSPKFARDKRDAYYKLPRFFRWLVPFRVALMSTPRNAIDVAALSSAHLGIRHVLTLTEEGPLDSAWFTRSHTKNTYLPIPNFHPPTIEQMDLIVRLLQDPDNLPVLIHCGGGKGRAGTVAACYLAAFGFSSVPDPCTLTQPTMSAPEAIQALRTIRPGSLETEQQEQFVGKWCSAIWKRQKVIPDPVPEPPPCPLEIEGTLDPESNLFFFVGLPGSGKTWVARSLIARNRKRWTWINQDEAGVREACENAMGHAPKSTGAVILDRCNSARDDRASWLSLAAHWSNKPVVVWFDYAPELCIARAQNRAGHPTLPPGNRVRSAVAQMRRIFVRPTLDEGFSAVVTIRSFAAAEEFVARISPPVTVFKFPRTPHLLDLGGATDDDIVSPSFPVVMDPRVNVVITEKVDGANMGFSLSSDRTEIVVQNRSHYVNPSTHEQFKRLGLWVDARRADLYKVLDRDPFFAQRYVLFGEWLAATHSIAYSKLPDWFLAFDLYDRSTGTWADRPTLSRLLAETGIRMVPLLHEGSMPPEQELKKMVQGLSHFTEGRMEGVYVKTEVNGEVIGRGKVVRGDFISGNEHWTKGRIRANEVVRA